MTKTLDNLKIFRAFALMSKDLKKGVNYKEFVKENIILEANYLINEKYAIKNLDLSWRDPENISYCLTEKGKEYLDKIVQYSIDLLSNETKPLKKEDNSKDNDTIQTN